jgi:predicted PhzF superfamily epimerase YddE/YHI9
VLLKQSSEGVDGGLLENGSGGATNAEDGGNGVVRKRRQSDDEACHHVHHSSHNQLIGYICGTRCHEFAPPADLQASTAANSGASINADIEEVTTISADQVVVNDSPQAQPSNSINTTTTYPYPMKHEPTGPYLAIHSIVVDPQYQNHGVARTLLENYIKSIEIWNACAESKPPPDSINKRGNGNKSKLLSMKNKKLRPTKIEKVICVTKSGLLDFFISVGFRWRATVSLGVESLYELELDVKALTSLPGVVTPSPLAATASALSSAFPYLHHASSVGVPSSSMEQDCYLVDAFANPRRCGSGNSAAIVVLEGPPSKLIAEHQSKMMKYNNSDNEGFNGRSELHNSGMWGMMNEQLNEILSNTIVDEEEEEELAEMRAEVWMHFVAREFNQPATAFVWPIENVEDETGDRGWNETSSVLSDEELSRRTSIMESGGEHEVGFDLDATEASSDITATTGGNNKNTREIHHFVRFYTRAGIEVDMCAHATLAAASILFRRYSLEQYHESKSSFLARNKEIVLAFHSRKNIVLRALHAPSPSPSTLDDSLYESVSSPIPSPGFSPMKTSGKSISSNTTQHVHNVIPPVIRIAMDYPWRTVEQVPAGADGQVAVIAMLRRAFFGAWSVVTPEEEDNDHETDELASFGGLSVHHVVFMGMTKGNEDLLIELTVDGFELLSGRNVDYAALKHGWSGYRRGVIVCCEVPETLAEKSASESDIDAFEGTGLPRPALGHVRHVTIGDIVNPLGGIDFRSRYFEPKSKFIFLFCLAVSFFFIPDGFNSLCIKVGVNEDPVSGWPHCALGPYFGARRGKQRLVGIQESDRTGLVECILKEDEQKVTIIGSTLTTVAGRLQMQA